MKSKRNILSIVIAALLMLLLILDTETVSVGASEGIELCIKTLVPALFPFFVVTSYINASLLGLKVPGVHKVGRLLGMPSGCESLLLLGLLGGYPVGAQLIADTYRQGQLSKRTGSILLGYCSNAGPAFIFGVAGSLFSSTWVVFVLWLIHVSSAIIAGLLLPKPTEEALTMNVTEECSVVQALQKSIRICASVCGWVVMFKIIQSYLEKWIFCHLNHNFGLLITGILELSNGCINLSQIPNEAWRFILCSVFLAFGGFCVLLQTISVTGSLGLGLYLPGKLIQSCISLLLALLLSYTLINGSNIPIYLSLIIIFICITIVMFLKSFAKKSCGNPENNPV